MLAAISLRNVWIAWREGGRGSMWIAAVLANVAVSIWWVLGASPHGDWWLSGRCWSSCGSM